MGENEAIKGLMFFKEKLYNGIFQDRLNCIDYAITVIKEIQQYREIGTVEECQEAIELQKPKKPIPINHKEYADKIVNAEFLEDAYLCPNCKTVIRSGSHCGRCGQKLNWNLTEVRDGRKLSVKGILERKRIYRRLERFEGDSLDASAGAVQTGKE